MTPTTTPIPHFYLYGRLEDDGAAAVDLDFLHIERIRKRSRPNNWTIPPHAHPHHMQILFVQTGGGTIDLEGREIPVEVPCLMAVPVASVHHIRFLPETDGWVITAAESFVMQAAMADAGMTETTRDGGVFALAGTGVDPAHVEESFQSLSREFVFAAPGRRPAIMAYFITVLVALLRVRASERAARPGNDERAYALVLRYRDLIERHFRAERRVEFYADALSVTRAQLNTICKARLGKTASGLLYDRIITEAKRWLIYTGMSAAEIGYALGFDDPAYFSRFFSRRTGVPPGRLREALGVAAATELRLSSGLGDDETLSRRGPE
ncbi:MAG: AraC family transcriptional regulator [Rhodovulum sulfidophilum]|uniref:AraC family transcriptional regulator n=1 Tax=Rhodovulum sulfidophilum TaxID=35806 RepID=A0A2W5N248_RHOSU|nr:MAG: AraC family transcriptional regulator [Rhodovulum sulfidophilum]